MFSLLKNSLKIPLFLRASSPDFSKKPTFKERMIGSLYVTSISFTRNFLRRVLSRM